MDFATLTKRGVIYSCKFVSDAEIAATSTKVGTKMSIKRLSVSWDAVIKMYKMARQLRKVLTRGMLKSCDHCTNSKAKQKNVS